MPVVLVNVDVYNVSQGQFVIVQSVLMLSLTMINQLTVLSYSNQNITNIILKENNCLMFGTGFHRVTLFTNTGYRFLLVFISLMVDPRKVT
jgi:hypothetical protein